MIVLAFDIATATGWAVGDTRYEIEDSGHFSCKSLVEAYKNFNSLMVKWKPDIVVCAAPTRFYKVTVKLSQITGVLLLAAEKLDIPIEVDLIDSSCKKVVLGNGRANKKDIMNYFGQNNEDVADAMLFWTYIKMINE